MTYQQQVPYWHVKIMREGWPVMNLGSSHDDHDEGLQLPFAVCVFRFDLRANEAAVVASRGDSRASGCFPMLHGDGLEDAH